MKKILCTCIALLLSISMMPAAAFGADPFLIGEWSTSDGTASLVFDADGSFVCDFGLFPEEGTWSAQATDSESFPIQMDGSSILTLMSLVYGGVNDNYHFEVLKCNDDNFYLVQVYGDYTARTSPCKLPLTREGKTADFTLGEETSPDSDSVDDTTEDENAVRELEVDFDSNNKVNLNWGWNLFNKDSSVYDHNLAMVGLVLSQAVESSQETAEYRFQELGFQYTSSAYYDRGFWDADAPAVTCASQKITMNGQDKFVFAIAVRGTKAEEAADWLTDIKSQGDGFVPAANTVKTTFETFYSSMKGIYGDKPNADNSILFITGHSLGGAVASQLAPMLENSYGNRNTIFDYTFAAANHESDSDRASYKNVHNIINVHDLVPNVPLGYKKVGNKWFYDSSESDKYQSYFDRVYKTSGWHPGNIVDEHILSTYLAMMLCDVPSNIGSGATNPYSLTSIHCPVDITVYDSLGALLGTTSGDNAKIEDSSDVAVMTDGESKYIVAPYGYDYTVAINGTGNGTMNVVQQRIDSYSGEVVDEKTFDPIEVVNGAKYRLEVDGDAVAEHAVLQYEDADESVPASSSKPVENDGFPWLVIVVVGAVVVIVIALFVLSRNRKKKKRRRKKSGRKKRQQRSFRRNSSTKSANTRKRRRKR